MVCFIKKNLNILPHYNSVFCVCVKVMVISIKTQLYNLHVFLFLSLVATCFLHTEHDERSLITVVVVV
jgi:hypothetical protein